MPEPPSRTPRPQEIGSFFETREAIENKQLSWPEVRTMVEKTRRVNFRPESAMAHFGQELQSFQLPGSQYFSLSICSQSAKKSSMAANRHKQAQNELTLFAPLCAFSWLDPFPVQFGCGCAALGPAAIEIASEYLQTFGGRTYRWPFLERLATFVV